MFTGLTVAGFGKMQVCGLCKCRLNGFLGHIYGFWNDSCDIGLVAQSRY